MPVIVPVVPAAPIICRERGCSAPPWLEWLLHWPGMLVGIGGILVLIAAAWWWSAYW